MLKKLLCIALLSSAAQVHAQDLKPGFDANEYKTLLRIAANQVDAPFREGISKEFDYTRVYKSKDVGLHNQFDLWINKNKSIAVISLRGTTFDNDSWLENFYSAMVPANGQLRIDSNYIFKYKLSTDPKALVHIGWLIGTGSLAPIVESKIKEYYQQGIKNFIITGHSQGGALSFMITALLKYKVSEGHLPADITFKTYSSAAPKPGNLYFAYDYDYITRGGWAFSVINTADWVPETPFGTQTVTDFNKLNPFTNAKQTLNKQKLPIRIAGKYIYRRLDKTSRKAQKKQEKYLGRMTYKMVKKYLPYLEKPKYAPSSNYAKAGIQIILQPDSTYYQKYPDTGSNIFRHHVFAPYYYLTNKTYK